MFHITITTNSISWKSQQPTTFILVMVGIVAGIRPISTSHFNINLCSPIGRGIVAGLLWPIFTFINKSSAITRGRLYVQTWPTSTTSANNWCRLAGLLIPMSTTFMTYKITWWIVVGLKIPTSATLLSRRHFNTFLFRNFSVVVATKGGIIYGISRPRS